MAGLSSKGRIVMREYGEGKLRSSSGQQVTTPEQAYAIAKSEERAGRRRGWSRRKWRGRNRIRPNRVRRRR